jgi:hypothetical protein
MAATANLGIGGYYDDDCYVVRRRVLTPFQRASSRKMSWRIEATCTKRAAGRHGRLDAIGMPTTDIEPDIRRTLPCNSRCLIAIGSYSAKTRRCRSYGAKAIEGRVFLVGFHRGSGR